MSLPAGWTPLNPYAIRNGEWTVCKVGSERGWSYELWRGTEQVRCNLATAAAAIELIEQPELAACG